MDKVQKHNSLNTNTPSSESYKNYHHHPIVGDKMKIPSYDCCHKMGIPTFTLSRAGRGQDGQKLYQKS
jgi:hypothetical protein